MAVGTALANRRMFPDEGTAFLGVTVVANLVEGIGLEQRIGARAMWIMAIDAAHLAFSEWHVSALLEVSALLGMAVVAGLGDGVGAQRAGQRGLGHRIMAVTAGDLILVMHRADPMQSLAALMTG